MMPKGIGNLRYLPVLVVTYTCWVEAFPSRTEKASETENVLKEIIHWFRLPFSIQSDCRGTFIAKGSQEVASFLRI